MDKYTPSRTWNDEEARKFTAPCADRHQWDAWLAAHDARVAREALDGLAATHDAQALAHFGLRNASRIGQEARIYRDTHYPETED